MRAFEPRTLAEALRMLLARSAMRQEELGRRLGVSSGSMSNYINGLTVPPATVLRRIAESLSDRVGVEAEELWTQLGMLLVAEETARSPGDASLRAWVLIDLKPGVDHGLLVRVISDRIPGVVRAEAIQGPHDLMVMVQGRDARELIRRVVDPIHELDGVERTLTCLSVGD
jgi:transcriptional regulator with XRE-family HTH domain